MRAHRRRVALDLKNAKKRKARLHKRARLLSTEDLLTVVALREGTGFESGSLFTSSQSTREGSPAGEGATDAALSDGPNPDNVDDRPEREDASS